MDKYGPERLLQAYEPKTGGLGLLVIDNTTLGPGLGSLNVLEKVTIEKASSLARRYTLMNSLQGVPFGGACACILKGADLKAGLEDFALSVGPLSNKGFIALPGTSVGEDVMEAYAYACGDVRGAVGKPSRLKGIPFEVGAVGLGIAHCALATLNFLKLGGGKASVFGMGRDGLFAARTLAKNGIEVVAAADSEGATVNPEGLDIESLANLINSGGRIEAFPRGMSATVEQALAERVDLMVLAGDGFINRMVANEIKPRVVLEGTLGAVDRESESMLEARGIIVIPDILACGGASISAHVEYIGGNVVDMTEILANSVKRTTISVLEEPGKSFVEGAERIAFRRMDEEAGKAKETLAGV
ncbi:MAG: hypothetical protein ABIF01_03190 [Candidatus Micrarchaeota archaeon]